MTKTSVRNQLIKIKSTFLIKWDFSLKIIKKKIIIKIVVWISNKVYWKINKIYYIQLKGWIWIAFGSELGILGKHVIIINKIWRLRRIQSEKRYSKHCMSSKTWPFCSHLLSFLHIYFFIFFLFLLLAIYFVHIYETLKISSIR